MNQSRLHALFLSAWTQKYKANWQLQAEHESKLVLFCTVVLTVFCLYQRIGNSVESILHPRPLKIPVF